MRDALKSYLALAGGLVEVPRQKALAAAKALVAQGEATAEQVSGLAEDLVAQSRANRDAVSALVKYEVDRALGRVGLASNEEVGDLAARVHALEAEVRALRSAAGGAVGTSSSDATAPFDGPAPTTPVVSPGPSAAAVKAAAQAKARKTGPATRVTAHKATPPTTRTAAEVKAAQRDAARKSPAERSGARRGGPQAPHLASAADAKKAGHPDVPGSAGKES